MIQKLKKLGTFLLSLLCLCHQGSAHYLLKAPEPFDKNISIKYGLSMDFNRYDKSEGIKSHYRFEYKNGKTYIIIQFEGNLPQELTEKESKKLTKSVQGGEPIWSFIYPDPPSSTAKKELLKIESPTGKKGITPSSLIVNDGKPKTLSVKELAQKLMNKHVVFYTGSGISAAIIPTMNSLMKKLNIKVNMSDETLLKTVKKALLNPKAPLHHMDEFNKKCLNAQPTQAHKALKKIVTAKNWGLITENLDQLHQKTGIIPLHRGFDGWIDKNVPSKSYKKIDVVITVGLKTDERGFLKTYKQENPNGIIIAFDLSQPIYLSNNDFFVSGDCQKTIPDFLKALEIA